VSVGANVAVGAGQAPAPHGGDLHVGVEEFVPDVPGGPCIGEMVVTTSSTSGTVRTAVTGSAAIREVSA
jgi:hypothetical protein